MRCGSLAALAFAVWALLTAMVLLKLSAQSVPRTAHVRQGQAMAAGGGGCGSSGIAFIIKTGKGRPHAQWILDTWMAGRPEPLTVVSDSAGELLRRGATTAATDSTGGRSGAATRVPIFDVLQRSTDSTYGAALRAFLRSAAWRAYAGRSSVLRGKQHGPGGPPVGSSPYALDRFKFVPALQLSYARFPGCAWHVLVDDDAFVLVPALEQVRVRVRACVNGWLCGMQRVPAAVLCFALLLTRRRRPRRRSRRCSPTRRTCWGTPRGSVSTARAPAATAKARSWTRTWREGAARCCRAPRCGRSSRASRRRPTRWCTPASSWGTRSSRSRCTSPACTLSGS